MRQIRCINDHISFKSSKRVIASRFQCTQTGKTSSSSDPILAARGICHGIEAAYLYTTIWFFETRSWRSLSLCLSSFIILISIKPIRQVCCIDFQISSGTCKRVIAFRFQSGECAKRAPWNVNRGILGSDPTRLVWGAIYSTGKEKRKGEVYLHVVEGLWNARRCTLIAQGSRELGLSMDFTCQC